MEELAINYQKRMNRYLKSKKYDLAYKAFLNMNKARIEENITTLTMPSLQSRFEK